MHTRILPALAALALLSLPLLYFSAIGFHAPIRGRSLAEWVAVSAACISFASGLVVALFTVRSEGNDHSRTSSGFLRALLFMNGYGIVALLVIVITQGNMRDWMLSWIVLTVIGGLLDLFRIKNKEQTRT